MLHIRLCKPRVWGLAYATLGLVPRGLEDFRAPWFGMPTEEQVRQLNGFLFPVELTSGSDLRRTGPTQIEGSKGFRTEMYIRGKVRPAEASGTCVVDLEFPGTCIPGALVVSDLKDQ